jgi:uncharacterized membrane protein YedE/YeeE
MKALGFGILFGFVLSRAGATSYDAIRGMFLLTDLHLFGVIGTAVAVTSLAFALIRRKHWSSARGEPLVLAKKPMSRGLALGALLFGAGWAVTGSCPGTVLAQLGEGKLLALATFAGVLLGALAGEWIGARLRGAEWRHATDSRTHSPIDSRS